MYTQQGQNISNKKVDKQTIQFNIVDIDVDTVNLTGSINDFLTNSIHTIYVAKDGTNNANSSYLKTILSNSNIETVNLQNKILNIGIRFEKRLSSNSWGATDEISIVDADNYTKVKGNDFSKIQGRFNTRLSLSPANVDEVIKKRILKKTEGARETLELLYDQKQSI